LVVYPDITNNSVWIFCRDCKFAGDILSLAKKEWGLDLDAVIRKFNKYNVIMSKSIHDLDLQTRYENTRIATLDRMSHLINHSANTNFNDSPETLRIHDLLNMSSHTDASRWTKQMKCMFGWEERMAVEGAFRPACVRGDTAAGYDRVFIGAVWNWILVIPFYDLPGRPVGFWFTGRQTRWPDDWVYRSITVAGRYGKDRHEAGIGFYEALFHSYPKFGNSMFAVVDPRLAIRLHSRWFRDYSSPAPVICSYDGRKACTRNSWSLYPDKEFIFCSATPKHEIFSQAAYCDGKVYIEPISIETDLKHCQSWFLKAKKKARPWSEVLEDYAKILSDSDLELLMSRIYVNDLTLDTKLKKWKDKSAYDRVMWFLDSKQIYKAVNVTLDSGATHTVRETRDGWYSGEGVCTSNAIIRICSINKKTKQQEIEIIFDKITHSLGMKPHSKSLYSFIQDEMINKNIGVFKCSKAFTDSLEDIALQFYTPEIID
jgi:hypothetical protein